MEYDLFCLDKSTPIKLAQVTDTHLFGDSAKELLGINTFNSMSSVLQLVQQHQDIDLMLISGDISQDDSLESYQILQRSLAPFHCPQFWYKGNHDNYHIFDDFVTQLGVHHNLIRTPHWQIILLNSQVEGAVFGYLAADQLQFLEHALSTAPNLHSFISFHHHPLSMGSRWLDKIGLQNADDFLSLIQRFNNVRAVLWGHVHQESDQTLDGVRFLSTPSTCVQFKPHCENFTVDTCAPGFRWLTLHPDGRIETAVERLPDQQFLPDAGSGGY